MMDAMMNAEQANVRHADEFRREFRTLVRAAVGVIMVRARDPYRAIEAIRSYAIGTATDYKNWTILNGWESYDRNNPQAAPSTDDTRSPLEASSISLSERGRLTVTGITIEG